MSAINTNLWIQTNSAPQQVQEQLQLFLLRIIHSNYVLYMYIYVTSIFTRIWAVLNDATPYKKLDTLKFTRFNFELKLVSSLSKV